MKRQHRLSRGADDEEVGEEVDPFHLQSHPIQVSGEERGEIFIQGYEASVDFERGKMVAGQANHSHVNWKGIDGNNEEVEISTDR